MLQSLTSCCAKIASPAHEWDITEPHLNHATEGSMEGTAFFVRGSDVAMPDKKVVALTNYHVIEHNAQHVARVFTEDGGYHDCKILHVCPSLDFAIIEAYSDACKVCDVTTAVPACGNEVMIPGFPLNTSSDSCQFSYGHMSAPLGDQWIQCSLSCNHGNSGGPLILTKCMSICGICTASPVGSEGITLALPMLSVVETIRKFRVPGETIIRTPRLQSTVTPVTSAWSALMHVPEEGLRVSNVSPYCPLRDLQDGDIITHVNGIPVNAHTGKLSSPELCWDVDLASLSAWILLPEDVHVTVHRLGIRGKLNVQIRNGKPPLPPIRKLYPLWERIPVLSLGGAICVPLCQNVLEAYEGYADCCDLRQCWNVWDSRGSAKGPMVVIVFVEPHSYASACGLETLHVFKTINNSPVSTIEDIVRLLTPKRATRCRVAKIDMLTCSVAVDMDRMESRQGPSDFCPLVLL